GWRRLALDAKLVDEREHEVVRARAAGGIGNGVVSGDVLDGLQRRVSFHVPIQVSGPGERGQQDAQRRASGERAHDPSDADAGAEIGAAGDDGLHGLARALGADVSSTRLCRLKMPASWPSVGAWFSQLLIWPMATLS